MESVCQEMASCMSRAKHLPMVCTNTARGCTADKADKGCRLVWKFMRELVGILVTSMSIFGLQALAVSQRKMFARGRDDYRAITTILHAIYPWPPLLWRLRGVCVEGYGWIKAPGRGGCGIWCRYFRLYRKIRKLHDIGAYGVGLANAAARAARGVCDQGP